MSNQTIAPQITSHKNFDGFKKPKENWSKLPHQFIESMAEFKSKAEMCVILYVLRHTWGFQEYADFQAKPITTNEFAKGRKRADGTRMDNGTGMSKPSIYSGLKSAVEHGFLRQLVDNSDLGRVTHYYFLRANDDNQPGIVYTIDPKLERQTIPWHDIPSNIKDIVYKRSQGRCSYCDRKSKKWHYDHIFPKSRGGSDEEGNLALSCPPCNLSKNDRTPPEWGNECHFYDKDDTRAIYNGWKDILPDEVKKLYREGLKSFTGGGKESLPRTEKETIEKETIETAAAATVFTAYENNIGMLSPILSEKIGEAIDEYPHQWLLDAIQEAATHNGRSWAYIEKILKRWKVDGRGSRKTEEPAPNPNGDSGLPSWLPAHDDLPAPSWEF